MDLGIVPEVGVNIGTLKKKKKSYEFCWLWWVRLKAKIGKKKKYHGDFKFYIVFCIKEGGILMLR